MNKHLHFTILFASILIRCSLPSIAVAENIDTPLLLQNGSIESKYLLVKTDKIYNVSIGGVAASMNSQQVMNILGKPKKLTKTYNDGETCGDRGYLKKLIYDRLKVEAFDAAEKTSSSSLINIYTTNPAYVTDQGVKVGDPIAKARKIYDRMLPIRDNSPEKITYGTIGSGLTLNFGYNKGKITYIEINDNFC